MITLQEMSKQNIKLPSPPGIAVRLMEALRSDAFSYAGIAEIIQSDPALTARVLTVVNSAYYSLSVKVGSLDRALAIMGVNAVKNIALSFILIDGLARSVENRFDLDYFWRRSITAAVSSELLAPYLDAKQDDIFVTSLLQDIGVFVMCRSRPDDYAKVLDEKKTADLPVEVIEKRMFGFDHQEVGSLILEQWGLPESIYLPIRHHHCIEQASEQYLSLAKVLYLSDRISSLYNDAHCAVKVREIAGILGNSLGMCDSDLNALIDKVADRSLEIFSCFGISPGDMKQFTCLLQEANEELSKLNFSYESLLAEIRQEKSKTEKLAQELKEANERLWELSFRDELTGLYNRRYLFDFLDREMNRSDRNGSCLALLMLDIDHFKKVNDTYGHQTGDLVLKMVGKELRTIIRNCDVVVRYGGEEFIVVLPETDLKGALCIAERLREAVANAEVTFDDHRVRVTISVGAVVRDLQNTMVSADSIIAIADNALYRAKTAGRNRVCKAMSVVSGVTPHSVAVKHAGETFDQEPRICNAV